MTCSSGGRCGGRLPLSGSHPLWVEAAPGSRGKEHPRCGSEPRDGRVDRVESASSKAWAWRWCRRGARRGLRLWLGNHAIRAAAVCGVAGAATAVALVLNALRSLSATAGGTRRPGCVPVVPAAGAVLSQRPLSRRAGLRGFLDAIRARPSGRPSIGFPKGIPRCAVSWRESPAVGATAPAQDQALPATQMILEEDRGGRATREAAAEAADKPLRWTIR